MYYSSDGKGFGFDALQHRTVQQLENLATIGLEVEVGGQQLNVKVVLDHVSGDNLGMHGLCGKFCCQFSLQICKLSKH